MDINTLTDNKAVDPFLYILDPLSVIIKLAILSNKPIGTKINIVNNIIHFQIPGPFQSICRIVFKYNKTELSYLYNPIQIACQYYLTKDKLEKYPQIVNLFKFAQNGLNKLGETYKYSSIIRLCLNYYNVIISSHIEHFYNDTIFKKDHMTGLYTNETTNNLHENWKEDKINIVLNLSTYLSIADNAAVNVKALETLMDTIDQQTQEMLSSSSFLNT